MKSFLKRIAREFTGNLHKNRMKFPDNSRAFFFEKRLHYCTIIASQKFCEKPANRRGASDEKPTPIDVSVMQLNREDGHSGVPLTQTSSMMFTKSDETCK